MVVGVVSRFDAYQRRHRWLGVPIAVVYKFIDDQGGYLAALITYYGFLSLFPLLLIFSTVLGFLLPANPALQQQLIDSALGQFPIIGDQLGSTAQPLRGSGWGRRSGSGGALGGLGVAVAIQNAFNQVWGVPVHRHFFGPGHAVAPETCTITCLASTWWWPPTSRSRTGSGWSARGRRSCAAQSVPAR